MRSSLPLALLLLALPARAQDAGPIAPPDAGPVDAGPSDPPTRCGSLDERGACFGDVAAWCSVENPGGTSTAPTERIDCASLPGPAGTTIGRCLEIASVGAWCGVQAGERCAFPGEEGVLQMACLDESGAIDDEAACDLERGCVAGAAACTTTDPAGTCIGDRLQLGCAPFGQPRVLDCAALGGRCEAEGCVALDEGAPCDDGRLGCDDGLVCAGAGAGALGRCVPRGESTEPVDVVDAGQPPLPPRADCSMVGGDGFAWFTGLLGGLLMTRRRRQRSVGR